MSFAKDGKLGFYIVGQRTVLWRYQAERDFCEIVLSFQGRVHHEGDLSLIFQNGGVSYFEMSFLIVPGRLIGAAVRDGMLIGRVQGTARPPQIRAAARLCKEVAPSHVLMAAVEGVAKAQLLAQSEASQQAHWH